MIVCSGTVAMVRGVRMPPGCGVVVMGIGGVTTLHFQEMGKLEPPPPPSPLEAMSNSLVESLRMVCSEDNLL
jgi:hypothetical protein